MIVGRIFRHLYPYLAAGSPFTDKVCPLV
jgi:hypothetical protein